MGCQGCERPAFIIGHQSMHEPLADDDTSTLYVRPAVRKKETTHLEENTASLQHRSVIDQKYCHCTASQILHQNQNSRFRIGGGDLVALGVAFFTHSKCSVSAR